jgi:membrane associated rhomboid family serine protease
MQLKRMCYKNRYSLVDSPRLGQELGQSLDGNWESRPFRPHAAFVKYPQAIDITYLNSTAPLQRISFLSDREQGIMKIFCCPICHDPLRGQTHEGQLYRECPQGHGLFVRDALFFHFSKECRPYKEPQKQYLSTAILSCPGCNGRLEKSQGYFSCRSCSSHWLGEAGAVAFKKWKERVTEDEKTAALNGPAAFLPWISGLSSAKPEGFSSTVLWMAFALVAMFFVQAHIPALGRYAVFYPTDPFHNFGANFFVSLFSHGNIQHLCSNLFFLLTVGSLVERHLEKGGALLIFFLSGVAANIAQIAFGLPYPTLGASGGIAGLVAALVLLEPKAHLTFSLGPIPNARLYLPCELLALLWLLIEIHGLLRPVYGINHWAHLSGAFAGFLCLQLKLVTAVAEEERRPDTPSVGVNPARPVLWR